VADDANYVGHIRLARGGHRGSGSRVECADSEAWERVDMMCLASKVVGWSNREGKRDR